MKENFTLNKAIREAILQGLMKLLKTRRLENITVQDLTKVAGVSRSSFYRNFESKEQVLFLYLKELYQAFLAEEKRSGRTDRKALLVSRFHFIREHQDLFWALHRNNLIFVAFDKMEMDIISMLSGTDQTLDDYYRAMLSGSFAAIIDKWFDHSLRESDEQMAELFCRIPFRLDDILSRD